MINARAVSESFPVRPCPRRIVPYGERRLATLTPRTDKEVRIHAASERTSHEEPTGIVSSRGVAPARPHPVPVRTALRRNHPANLVGAARFWLRSGNRYPMPRRVAVTVALQ